MRAVILETLYELSKMPYQRFMKKNESWSITTSELLRFPENSLGFHLGCFLLKHNFEMQPKLESHDVFHVLTGTGTSVPEEISMQFYLLGNGKRSLYLFMVIILGTLFYPDYRRLFLRAFRRGKNALPFHQIDFSKMLNQSVHRLQLTFLIH